MLDKLERAVSTISENSNRVSVILERHESRLDESERTDSLIIKMIEEVKDQEERNHKILHDRIDRIQKKVDSNQKFVVGVVQCWTYPCCSVTSGSAPVIEVLTSQNQTGMIGGPQSASIELHRHEVYQPGLSTPA